MHIKSVKANSVKHRCLSGNKDTYIVLLPRNIFLPKCLRKAASVASTCLHVHCTSFINHLVHVKHFTSQDPCENSLAHEK